MIDDWEEKFKEIEFVNFFQIITINKDKNAQIYFYPKVIKSQLCWSLERFKRFIFFCKISKLKRNERRRERPILILTMWSDENVLQIVEAFCIFRVDSFIVSMNLL